MADKVRVGHGNCTFLAIRKLILAQTQENKGTIINNLLNVALSLGLCENDIQLARQQNILQMSGNLDSFQRLLGSWIQKQSDKATLQVLIDAFKENDLDNFAMALHNEFVSAQTLRRNVAHVTPIPMEEDTVDYKVQKETLDEPTSHAVKDSFSDFFRSLKNIFNVSDHLPENFQDPLIVKPQTRVVRPDEEDTYQLPTGFKGYFLLINIVKFEKNEDRLGAAIDTRRLSVVFEALGYEVVCCTGSDKTFTKETFAEAIDKFKIKCATMEVKSFGVFLGGHGNEGLLEMSDGSKVDLESEVFEKLCIPPEGYEEAVGPGSWTDIPKMFFIQACRTPVKKDTSDDIKNCLVSYACGSGKPAYRTEKDGSFYVSALTNNLALHAKEEDILSILQNKVINQVQCYSILDGNQGSDMQVPEHVSKGGFGKLYFNMSPFHYTK